MIDYQRQNAMKMGQLSKKVEELTRRVEELESERDRSSAPPVSKLSPDRVRKLKESVTQS